MNRRSTKPYIKPMLSLLALTVASGSVSAQQATRSPQGVVEEIVVFGRDTDLVGRADAASEGSVSGADLLIRPMLKTAELLESMPGMVAVQHSGSGKANQFFLRGFNLDHGTDYSVYFDGAPMNLRSHGHGQGYLDVNGMIPETVESIDYRKGPYRADLGDFSIAGASFIKTIDRVENNFVSSEVGQYGWNRFAGGMSQDVGSGTLSLIGEYKLYDGPWDNSEDLEHIALWGKYLQDTSFGQARVTLSIYDATWNPTEQIPERAIGTLICPDEFCTLDPSADGHTQRWILSTQLSGDDWDANLYSQYYDWDMKSNPTYDYQIGQFDKRWTIGANAKRTLIDGTDFQLIGGGSFRYDDISKVGVSEYAKGSFIAPISNNAITELSIGTFLEASYSLNEQLRLLGGIRADYYNFDVTAFNANSAEGKKTATRASPKVGVAYALTEALEFYGNWGRGFHSNDARGVVNSLDPVPGISPGTGYELGARSTLGDFKFTAAYWWLDQDSELIFVGDSNSVEPKGASEREGLELTMFWHPTSWLGVDAVYTTSEARYLDNPDGVNIEGALEDAAQLGVSITTDDWDISLRARYMGPYALLADNSDRADPLTLVSMRAARHWESLTVYAEVINMLDSDGKEIVYNYPAYIAGLDPVGLDSETIDCETSDCRMSRVTAPRTFRLGVSYKF